MKKPLTDGGYSVRLSDFGPMVKANVDMRPLTVFVGPSNTGKSYLAVLLYALHLALRARGAHFGRLGRRFGWPVDLPGRVRGADTELKVALARWIETSSVTAEPHPMPEVVTLFVRRILQSGVGLENRLAGQLARCYGVDAPQALIRKRSSKVRIGLIVPSTVGADAIRLDWEIGHETQNFAAEFSDAAIKAACAKFLSNDFMGGPRIFPSYNSEEITADDVIQDKVMDYIISDLISGIIKILLRPIISREIYYLPADRTGIMHSHQVLVSTLIQNSARAGIDPSHVIPVLSGVLADFLDQLISIGRNRRGFSSKSKVRRDAAHEIAEKMERDILHGDVQLNRSDAGYSLFDYKPDSWREEIPLMRSSSMVSELAPVVLYLRHLVNPGDVLIIEEPESHLHPKMQASFAIQLSLLVRSGIRVIVTTHSEWLLEQFANLVRLSNLPESKREGIPGSLAALRPDEFGAWSFEENDRPKGSIVKEIKVDFEAGGLLTDFDDTADDLYNTWAEIGNRIIMKDDRVDQN